MAITRGAGNLICVGEAEHDADVLLSLSALIKAAELRMVFEGILSRKTLQIKGCVLPVSGKTEESYSTQILPLLLHQLNTRLTISCHFRGMIMELGGRRGKGNCHRCVISISLSCLWRNRGRQESGLWLPASRSRMLLNSCVSSQMNRSWRNVRFKPRLMLLIHQLMNLAN